MRKVKKALLYCLLVCVLFWLIFPLFWTFLSSITIDKEQYTYYFRFPQHVTFDRYLSLLTGTEKLLGKSGSGETLKAFRYGMFNSVFVSIVVTLICLVIGTMAAYAFTRLKFWAKNVTFSFIVGLRMVPAMMLIIPFFLMVNAFNLLDTKTALIGIYSSFTLPLIILIMKNFFEKIPLELEESAKIDGCGTMGILIRIVLPISLPGLTSALMIAFITAWSEFALALVVTNSLNSKTLPVIIAEFVGRQGMDYGMLSTGAIISSIPILVIALIAQKYIVEGLTMGGVKE